jgi:hypothetical protein
MAQKICSTPAQLAAIQKSGKMPERKKTMNTQIATLPDTGVSNAKNLGGKLETVSILKLLAYSMTSPAPHSIVTLVDARFYMARSGDGASPVHCTVWVSCDGFHTSGYGVASGYGYDKSSAALADALQNAGIMLAKDISGLGSSAMSDAIFSIGNALISRAPIGAYVPTSLTVI